MTKPKTPRVPSAKPGPQPVRVTPLEVVYVGEDGGFTTALDERYPDCRSPEERRMRAQAERDVAALMAWRQARLRQK